MKYEIEMTKQEIKDLRAVRNYFGENDRTIFEHKAYAILDGIVKKLNTPRVSVAKRKVCPKCGETKDIEHIPEHYDCHSCGEEF